MTDPVMVPRKDLRSVARRMGGLVFLGVVFMLVYGVRSCDQDQINARQKATDARLSETVTEFKAYVQDQLHQRDLDTARACVSNHVRYEVFKSVMTDLVGAHPEVWERYPSPACDRAAAEELLARG